MHRRPRWPIVIGLGSGAALIVLGALYWLANLSRGGGCRAAVHTHLPACDAVGAAGVGGQTILVVVLAGTVLFSVSLAGAAVNVRRKGGDGPASR